MLLVNLFSLNPPSVLFRNPCCNKITGIFNVLDIERMICSVFPLSDWIKA